MDRLCCPGGNPLDGYPPEKGGDPQVGFQLLPGGFPPLGILRIIIEPVASKTANFDSKYLNYSDTKRAKICIIEICFVSIFTKRNF